MHLACLDLEGVLIPEIWIEFARKTSIDELLLTTRDEPDYDKLMQYRLSILRQHNLKVQDIQEVISTLDPLPGAAEFLNQLRQKWQLVILSDTFYQFAMPLMAKLGYPTLLCHQLVIDSQGMIADYQLRQRDPKRMAVHGFHGMNCKVVASGDSYNDTSMLQEADAGILFCPPEKVIEEFPQYPVARDYQQLLAEFEKAAVRI